MRVTGVLISCIYSLQSIGAHLIPYEPHEVKNRVVQSLRGGNDDTNDSSTLLRSRGGSAVSTSIRENENVGEEKEGGKKKGTNFLTTDIAASDGNVTDEIQVMKRNGQTQTLDREKIYRKYLASRISDSFKTDFHTIRF